MIHEPTKAAMMDELRELRKDTARLQEALLEIRRKALRGQLVEKDIIAIIDSTLYPRE